MDGSEPGRNDRSALERLVKRGIDRGLFTGAAVAVGSSGGVDRSFAVGVRDPRSDLPVTEETLFDGASLTKATVTTLVVLRLVETGAVALSDPIGRHLDAVDGTPVSDCPLEQFLTHTTGLQPYYYDESWADPETARCEIYDPERHDRSEAGTYEYSCLNFVHLVGAVREATGESLATLADRFVFEPAGAAGARLGPINDTSVPVAVTRERDYVDGVLRGEIHDPIARVLGGESGNAGLFGSVRDVAAIAHALLNDGTGPNGRLLSPSTIRRMRAEWLPPEQRSHGLGWRRAADHSPGTNWSPESFGHTGYTGTSLWIDPVHDRFAVLLTNEIYVGKERGMARFRERFHNVVGGGRY